MLSLKAVLHGVVDHTFASRTASDTIAPSATLWTADEHDKILAIREDLSAKLAREVNRIEGQLSLMLSHLEGESQSKIARLQLVQRILPFTVGVGTGALVATVFAAWFR